MATTANYGWTTPDGTTSPPDVAGWIDNVADDIDGTVATRILSGAVGAEPVLEVGQLYAGHN